MRPIKFRAWDQKYKKSQGIVDLSQSRTYWEYPLGENDDYILCQFTGLLDKNGKEIYEGDIVVDFDKKSYQVLYDDVSSAFMFEDAKKYGYERGSILSLNIGDRYPYLSDGEVIGNIYENPELLTK